MTGTIKLNGTKTIFTLVITAHDSIPIKPVRHVPFCITARNLSNPVTVLSVDTRRHYREQYFHLATSVRTTHPPRVQLAQNDRMRPRRPRIMKTAQDSYVSVDLMADKTKAFLHSPHVIRHILFTVLPCVTYRPSLQNPALTHVGVSRLT